MAKKIEIEIVGDTKGFSKALNSASQDTSKLGSTFTALGKSAAIGLGALGVGAAAAGAKMIGMASDAAEVDSKLDVVFGNTLPRVTTAIDKFSEATGTSRFEMREQAADMGALLGPMLGNKDAAADMSVKFVQLATDLGSFNNIPTGEALEKIRAGLVGEAEPLRSLGVLLTEASTKEWAYTHGIAARGKELTEVQKVEARAGQIMAQTAQAQGDATRTADSFANQMKRLKSNVSDTATELGMSLLPLANKVVGSMNDGAKAVGEFFTRLSAAKGFQAKVEVVFDGLQKLGTEAIKIGVKLGKEIGDAIGAVNWTSVGIKMAGGLGEAFAKGLPVVGQIAGTLAAALTDAIESQNWLQIGREIGVGLKDGIKNGAKNFVKEGGQSVIEAAANPMSFAAKKLGGEVGASLSDSFGRSAQKGIVTEKQVASIAMTQGWDPAIANAALSGQRIGAGLATGMAAGIAQNAYLAAIEAALMVNHAYSAASEAGQMHSPSKLFANLGKWSVEGYITGVTDTLPALKGKMAETISAALEAARAKVEAYQERLGDAFGKLGDFVKKSFDKKTENILDNIAKKFDAQIARWQKLGDSLTPAEQALKDLDKSEDERSRAAALRAAQDAVAAAEAMDGGIEKEKALNDAREALRQANLANTRASLEATAAIERQKRDERVAKEIADAEADKARAQANAQERRDQLASNLDEQLAVLTNRLQKHPEEYDKIQKKIMALLKSYGVPFKNSGKILGDAFADGIRASFKNVESAAKKLAQIIADFIPHSPAKKGPLSKPPGWKSYLMDGFPSALNMAAGAAAGGGSVAGVSSAPARGGGGGGGGWPERIVLQVDGRVLTEVVRTEVARTLTRNK